MTEIQMHLSVLAPTMTISKSDMAVNYAYHIVTSYRLESYLDVHCLSSLSKRSLRQPFR